MNNKDNQVVIDITHQRSISEWVMFFEQLPDDVVIKVYNPGTQSVNVLNVEQGCE